MAINTTCECGTESNVSIIDSLKEVRFGCKDCGSSVSVEVTGITKPSSKRGR